MVINRINYPLVSVQKNQFKKELSERCSAHTKQ